MQTQLVIHLVFLGVILFQALFILVQWFFFRRKEHLYYIAYIVSIGLFILCRVLTVTSPPIVEMPVWMQQLSYQPLGMFSYWMYLRFARTFLNIKASQPMVHKLLQPLELVLVGFMILCLLLLILGVNIAAVKQYMLACYLVMVVLVIPVFVVMLRQRNILNNFLVIGCICYVSGGFTGMLLNYLWYGYETKSTVVFLGVEAGILTELLLLNTGFMLKNRILAQQVEQAKQKLKQQPRHQFPPN